MNIRFLEPAAAELYEAIVYYNIQRNGLGLEFAKEVEDTIDGSNKILKPGQPSPRQNKPAGA
jgi:hypothetical protein